jgi:hypothetical protein
MKKLTTVIPAIFNRIRHGSTFMSVMNYENNFGEVSNFGLVFHASYQNAVRKALNIWIPFRPSTSLEADARLELINSYLQTMSGFNPGAKSAHAYSGIIDRHLRPIDGCKWYDSGREVHIWGFRVHKIVLKSGSYPASTWGPLREAKQRLISMTPLINFRQFKIVEGRFGHIGVEKLTLTHHDLLRDLV